MAVLKTSYLNGNLVVNGHIIARNLKFLGGDVLHLHEVTDSAGNSVPVNGIAHRIPVFTAANNALGNSALEISTAKERPEDSTSLVAANLKVVNSYEYGDLESKTSSPDYFDITFAKEADDGTKGVNRIRVEDTNLCSLVKFTEITPTADGLKVKLAPLSLKTNASGKCYKKTSSASECYIKLSDLDTKTYLVVTDHVAYETDLSRDYTVYDVTEDKT